MTNEAREELERLIQLVALGNREAFSDLYDLTAPKLLTVCLRVLKDRAAAEETVQEVFVKVWKSCGRYQANGHSPMTWLITIARNTAIDRLRARKPTEDLADYGDRIAGRAPTPEQFAIATSEAARVQRCLEELDPDKRAAITGAYLDGKSYKDLAGEFEIPLNTIRTWLRRGLAALRDCVAR